MVPYIRHGYTTSPATTHSRLATYVLYYNIFKKIVDCLVLLKHKCANKISQISSNAECGVHVVWQRTERRPLIQLQLNCTGARITQPSLVM